MSLDLKTCFSIGLLCTVAGFTALPSLADEVFVRETNMAPGLIVEPAASVTTTTRTIETTPTSSVYISPAAPMLADETISRRTVVVGERPAASSSSTTATISSSLDNKPNYGERLRLLRQQLNKGTSNGWITSERASELSTRLSDLDSQERTVRTAGYLKVDCDTFEKALTGYNIDLSHSMEGHN